MIIRKADEKTEAGALPTMELIEAMGSYNEQLIKAGVMLDGAGLQPTSKGARLKFSAGRPKVVDGPFTETKELVAGFTIIDVKSKEEAIEWARRWPPVDGDGEVELEIRQLYEASDFDPEVVQAEERRRRQVGD